MKVLSLYCGAGGIDEGLKQAGIKTTLAIDVWNDACQTMKLNHPDTEILCDKVSNIKSSLGRFDGVVGGPPCPEFSRANSNRSLDPCEVNNFWEIVESTKAKFWIMENVQDVIKVIRNRKNYLVNCANYGVPQTRIRRIFTNLTLPKPSHARVPSSDLFGNQIKKWISVKEALGLEGLIQNRENFGWKKKKNLKPTTEPSNTLLTDSSDNGRWFISPLGFKNKNKKLISRSISEPSQTIVNGNEYQFTNYKIFSTKYLIGKNKTIYNKHPPNFLDACCSTITAKDRSSDDMITDGVYARKLTNEELAILQGFSKEYKFHGGKTSVRKQIGNAVPPPLIKVFAEQITTNNIFEYMEI